MYYSGQIIPNPVLTMFLCGSDQEHPSSILTTLSLHLLRLACFRQATRWRDEVSLPDTTVVWQASGTIAQPLVDLCCSTTALATEHIMVNTESFEER